MSEGWCTLSKAFSISLLSKKTSRPRLCDCAIYSNIVFVCLFYQSEINSPLLRPLLQGHQLGPEILSFLFKGNGGLLFILGIVEEKTLKLLLLVLDKESLKKRMRIDRVGNYKLKIKID